MAGRYGVATVFLGAVERVFGDEKEGVFEMNDIDHIGKAHDDGRIFEKVNVFVL